MKFPSGDLIFYVAVLLGGAIYMSIRLPSTAAEYQAVAVTLIVCVVVEAFLLAIRFRWSPELFVAITFFFLGWGVTQGVAEGFTRTRIGIAAGSGVALLAYPVLRREVRGRVRPSESGRS